ncbi:MAG TPA: hypothetical protein VHD76_12320, partial [Bryobacteraceae bacterium]|nr:hypothetical protein [Bryobacteraceae bacterium]HVX90271.1 hypothetical protein [Candidatus Paceibacterota bacterium]
ASERYQLEIRLKLQPIASHHLSELIRSDDKRERMCKMAGELFDAMAAGGLTSAPIPSSTICREWLRDLAIVAR